MTPKAFISYSWTSDSHRELVREWADKLMADGIEVLLDQYDLKEGHDKNSFMERMVADQSVTHVLMICDQAYAEKANSRKSGVGTESQIISQELYGKIEQSKFIPVVCELSADGEPHIPIFAKSRIWLNFSSPEFANSNWEQLVRVLYGKPLLQKPSVGKAPSYILEDSRVPVNPAVTKFSALKHAIHNGRTGIGSYRTDFFESCYQHIDSFRVRSQPDSGDFGQLVLKISEALIPIRDLLIDWVLLEGDTTQIAQFEESLNGMLEKLLEFMVRPSDVTSWNDIWFEPHRLFTYQVFLYTIGALTRLGKFSVLHDVFSTHYLLPESESTRGGFCSFHRFYASSESLNSVLAPEGRKLLSPAAKLIQRQAGRKDITFDSLMEADLIAFFAATLNKETRWFPQTLYSAKYYRSFPFFFRGIQHKHFQKIALIAGIADVNELRLKVKEGFVRLGVDQWSDFNFHTDISLWDALNMDKLDTLR